VAEVNDTVFEALKSIRESNSGALTPVDAERLRVAVLTDQKVDESERDLLEEMVQSQFRSIHVTRVGSNTEKLTFYPTSGSAKQVLQLVLDPPLDLEAAWSQGLEGWNQIVKSSTKNSVEEARVLAFVEARLSDAWGESNQGNGFKPFRDCIGRRYGFSQAAGGDTNRGRALLYRASQSLDQKRGDLIPDFLYNWVRPGGFL
jgi:hypothetical protein